MKRRLPGGFLDRTYLLLEKTNPKQKKKYKRRSHKQERQEAKKQD